MKKKEEKLKTELLGATYNIESIQLALNKMSQKPTTSEMISAMMSNTGALNNTAFDISETLNAISKTGVLESKTWTISQRVLQLNSLSGLIDAQFAPQISAIQSITENFKEALAPTTKMYEALTLSTNNYNQAVNQVVKSVEILNRFTNFSWYERTFREFGGDIEPSELNEENIAELLAESPELIEDISQAINNSSEKLEVGNLDDFIVRYINKNIGKISPTKYSFIVLIFSVLISSYSIYSDYTTNEAINKVIIPQVKENSNKLDDLEQGQENNTKTLLLRQDEIENRIINSLETISKESEEAEIEKNRKLENIIMELKKVNLRINKIDRTDNNQTISQ